MKVVVRVKLTPNAVQAPVLERTLRAVNEAANQVATVAHQHFGLKASVRELRNRAMAS